MLTEDRGVKQKLIEAGRLEFLQYGYERASLRRISALADVSTGAIYFFFRNKEDLFITILEETANTLKQLLKANAESELTGVCSSADNDTKLVTFLYKHREESIILLEKSAGTIYENYREELCEILEESFMAFYTRAGGRKYDSDIIKIVAGMRIYGLSELLHGDYSMKQAVHYTRLLAHYGDSGFEGMMKQYNDVWKSAVE